jgi:hypothetical protein
MDLYCDEESYSDFLGFLKSGFACLIYGLYEYLQAKKADSRKV